MTNYFHSRVENFNHGENMRVTRKPSFWIGRGFLIIVFFGFNFTRPADAFDLNWGDNTPPHSPCQWNVVVSRREGSARDLAIMKNGELKVLFSGGPFIKVWSPIADTWYLWEHYGRIIPFRQDFILYETGSYGAKIRINHAEHNSVITHQFDRQISKVATQNDKKIFVIADKEFIYHSVDAIRWKSKHLYQGTLWSMVVGSTHVYVGGDDGKVFISHNQGHQWQEYATGVSGPLWSISTADEKNVYAVSSNNTFLHSRDSGKTWNSSTVNLPAGHTVGDVLAPSPSDVFLVGYEGNSNLGKSSILQSTDYGTHWMFQEFDTRIVDFENHGSSVFALLGDGSSFSILRCDR